MFQNLAKQIIDFGDWILITSIKKKERILYDDLIKTLGYGEASCIAIAKERGWFFLTDDNKARKFSEKHNIEFSGTIGVLRSAVKRNIITLFDVEHLHQSMIDNGYYSPIKRIADIL